MLTKTVDEIHVRKCIAILVPNLVVHTRLGTKIYICLRTRKGQTILIQPIDTALFFMSSRRERPRLHQRLGVLAPFCRFASACLARARAPLLRNVTVGRSLSPCATVGRSLSPCATVGRAPSPCVTVCALATQIGRFRGICTIRGIKKSAFASSAKSS